MEMIRQNIRKYLDSIPNGVELVAVSKFHPQEAILSAYNEGQRIFGESRANEFVDKAKSLPDDIKWHFIGHLQTNKVRLILPHVSLIHSIDSEKLLTLVNNEAKRINRVVDVLLQIHVAQEDTKYGFVPEELISLIKSERTISLKNVQIRGIMGMASNTDDTNRIERDFIAIKKTFDTLKALPNIGDNFSIISMGMSDDYLLAIKHGSNMVRIGSSIFGCRY
ncbi:MAG: YggS family pyridoxal phosphate-dependent enzyme [Muribaculaceae bacterium]|nr:YggS family pyridoxal phosphate-dependent enzyme [Muribaculaceae bacterium]